MSKSLKILVIITCVVFVILLALLAVYFILLKTRIPKPKSDVEVVYKIGWNGYAGTVAVTSLETEVLYDSLTLFNTKALVQYTITGTVTNKAGWRPYIQAVHLSERWVPSSDSPDRNMAGDIQVLPIAGVEKDESYQGETLKFSVKVQDYLTTGGWGENIYHVSSFDWKDRIVLFQKK